MNRRELPGQHRKKLHSTTPIERLNKDVKRRADVVGVRRGIDPLDQFLILLTPKRGLNHPPHRCRAFEQNDEWQTASRYMQLEAFAQIDHEETDPILSISTQAA